MGAVIGGVTAIVGDLAGMLGCSVGLNDDITAITLVALGTSLPDTFASMTAATQDPFADASLGNVTGSNSVNVFLGLGLPWTIGAIYWEYIIGKPTEAWKNRPVSLTSEDTYSIFLDEERPGGPTYGFMVPAGELGFSVAVYSVLAVVAMLHIDF